MPINLEQLERAAQRFAQYTEAIEKIEEVPEEVRVEEAIVAERHREEFLPAAERLLNLSSAPLSRAVTNLVVTSGEPTAASPISKSAPQIETVVPLTVSTSGIIPEIIQRDNDLRPMRYLHIALLASKSVGRIRVSDSPNIEEGDATGFLVAPNLLMTNYHVLPSEDHAAAASVFFDDEEAIDGQPLEIKAFKLRPDVLFVADEELDYTIVAVSPRTASGVPLSEFGYFRLFRETGKLDPTQREAANIIQHPGGGPKKIALRDNYILKVLPDSVDPQKNVNSLFYGTDTLKGSSGAPVCSDQWYVVALHRGGVPKTEMRDGQLIVLRWDDQPATTRDTKDLLKYVTNEGTRISRIFHALEEKANGNADSHAAAALAQLTAAAGEPKMGPLSRRTVPLLLPTLPSTSLGGPEEIVRRRRTKFEGASGYLPTFLGDEHRIELPQMTSEVERELATLKDSDDTELKYANYSLMMNRERRTAFFIAGNIDGSLHWKTQGQGALPNRPPWSFDPRMDDAFQPDDEIFSNSMQRGHLFKREDSVWGADRDVMRLSDEHSFTITNATPMIANFNNVEWGDLEDIVSREAQLGGKISYFAGPVFRSTDRFFNELKANVSASERFQGMRVPETFWKIIAWVEDSNLKAAGFMLKQTDEILSHGPITEEINFGTYKKIPISEIEQATGLRFQELGAADSFDD
jgi:endonuclease G, mitochondrial